MLENDELYDLLPENQPKCDIYTFLPRRGINADSDRKGIIAELTVALSLNSMHLAVIDIGGHWGLFSLDAVGIPNGRLAKWSVVCFEPGPRVHDIREAMQEFTFADAFMIKVDVEGLGPQIVRAQPTGIEGDKREIHLSQAAEWAANFTPTLLKTRLLKKGRLALL